MLRALAVLLLVAACPAPKTPALPVETSAAPAAEKPARPIAVTPRGALPPKLVVLLVVDQLPQWAFAAKRGALTGGFDRLLREGEWHTGEHPSAATLTAPGHALLGTGEASSVTGIIGNSWWDRDAQVVVESVRDPKGNVTNAWLRVPGLGDAMAAANASRPVAGKAVAISLKDRASILPLGHTGTSIWYDPKTVAWTSLQPVSWLPELDRAVPIKPRLSEVWRPLDAAKLAQLAGVPDAQPGEIGDKGFGPAFPHDPGATKNPAATVLVSPLGNDLVLDAATFAISAEQLGADDTADLLVISFSANDYIGHAWGHESWEAWDELMRLDARLATFLDALDAKVGAGRWALIATSDHGASPMPKGMVTYASIKDAANKAAATELGGGDWIADAHFPYIYLSKSAQKERDRGKALRKVMFALRSFPALARVERTGDFAGNCDRRRGDAKRLCLAIDPQRSGDLFYVPREGWILGEEPHATAHGSLNAYDREVPLIVLGPGRTAHAAAMAPTTTLVPMQQIAPLLARWLGVPIPAQLPR